MANLYDDQSWGGAFFSPDHFSSRFIGTIKYSPSDGVVLHYRISGLECPPGGNVLHGDLDDGTKCTLIGKFDAKNSSRPTIQRANGSRSGASGFKALVIGDHILDEDIITKIDFKLNHLHPFFSSSHVADDEKYDENPALLFRADFGDMKVYQRRRYVQFSSRYVENKVSSKYPEVLNNLINIVKEFEEDNPDAELSFTNDIEYRVSLDFKSAVNLKTAYERMLKVSDLLSLLVCEPIHPSGLSIYVNNENSHFHLMGLECYPSTRIPEKTIRLCRRELNRSSFPINSDTVDISAILNSWFQGNAADKVIVYGLQYETYERSYIMAVSELVLFATQLESISHRDGRKKSKEKYEYPINKYAGDYIQLGLKMLFGVSELNDVGVCITELRGEITHIGRPKAWLEKLSLDGLVKVAHLLQLTALGSCLSRLGVPQTLIESYQKQNGPEI